MFFLTNFENLLSNYWIIYFYTIYLNIFSSFIFFNIKSKIISWIIIGGQLDEIVFFLVV